jgi:hypothetical protein
VGRQDLILTGEILGLDTWSLRYYKRRFEESERHILSKEKFLRVEREERKKDCNKRREGEIPREGRSTHHKKK